MEDNAPVLQVRGIKKYFGRRGQLIYAVDNVSFDVYQGRTLGLVGESGCGKSTLARCVARLYKPTAGEIVLQGRDISTLRRSQLRSFRRHMQMIFQDPAASLNPRRRVGNLIAEPLRVHKLRRGRDVRKRVCELMDLVGLLPNYINRYPHEFSGGQRQRIGIARALAVEPRVVIGDELVSALDVSVQAQIINLLADLQKELKLTYVIISHDLRVVRQVADHVAVMYLGRIIEIGETKAVYERPAHPYTASLLAAVPDVIVPENQQGSTTEILRGEMPSPAAPPAGCHYYARCPYATELCAHKYPSLRRMSDGREVACHFPLAQDQSMEGSADGN